MRFRGEFAKYAGLWYGKKAMKKRLISILMAAAMLLCALSGCGKDKEPEASPSPEITPDPHEGQVEVTNGVGGTIWVDEAEALDLFSLDRYSFSVTDGVVTYSKDDAALLRGVDVSEHQGEIDWKAVAAAGYQFAMIRVGYRGFSEGIVYADTLYKENIQGAQAAGLKVGVYFFSQAVSVIEAAEEAVFTAKLLEGLTLDLPVYYDWEIIGTQPARTDDCDARTVTDGCLEFCHLLETAGYETGVYSYIPHVYSHYILNDLAGLSVWMGDPGNFPEFYYEHSIWQYSVTGSVPGIEGDVDLDVLYVPVTAEDASAAAATPAEAAPAETGEPALTVTPAPQEGAAAE